MNSELLTMFQEDQADRTGDPQPGDPHMGAVVERDRARRRRVEELVAAGALQAPEDYFHAAMVFQHGERLEDYWRAHELAKKGAELGYRQARWLAAAAYDRWLMRQEKPQKYGTQYRADGDRWKLWDVDPATTDAERAEWGVPPLALALQKAEDMGTSGSLKLRLGPTLASVDLPGLGVEIQDCAWMAASMSQPLASRPEPLWPGDGPIPRYLPAGLTPCRVGVGYGATRPDGQIAVTWQSCFAPADEPFVYGWTPAEGGAPTLEPIDLGDRAGVWIGVAGGTPSRLVLRAGPSSCWLVGGELSRDELLRLATSLPDDAEGPPDPRAP